MKIFGAILSELVGLFVDDWAFAFSVLAWVGIIALLRPHVSETLIAGLLFLGFALITLLFVLRRARATPR